MELLVDVENDVVGIAEKVSCLEVVRLKLLQGIEWKTLSETAETRYLLEQLVDQQMQTESRLASIRDGINNQINGLKKRRRVAASYRSQV